MPPRILLIVLLLAVPALAESEAPAAPTTQTNVAATTQPAITPSRISAVTVYQGNALVTRDVDVPEGKGLVEMVVNPLPPETIDGSLFAESGDGIHVLTTRFRTRAVMEDTREAVRKLERQIKELQDKAQDMQKQVEVITQNDQFLSKLEGFTAATMQQMTEKGNLNADSTLKLAGYVQETRAADAKKQVDLQHQLDANAQEVSFGQRQLAELAAGASKTEREAVIVVDKVNAAAGHVRLSYVVGAANWHPLYKLHAGTAHDPVQAEYLAAIEQQTGEDWNGVDLVLSTAQPALNAAPPELFALDITVAGRGTPNQSVAGAGFGGLSKSQSLDESRSLRMRAQQELNSTNAPQAGPMLNAAAASEQYAELLAREDTEDVGKASAEEGPSVAFHLESKFSVPSRNDQQLVEVTRLDLPPAWFYKAVPILSPHVFRLTTLTNQSKYVILPGEATMYLGTDFVGRMNLPLVAIGEQFTVGFGVDPQIQLDRQLVGKTRSIQGGNQVLTYEYRVRVSSFKDADAQVQVWDRLPKAEAEMVDVELVHATPELSTDAGYLRDERPKNLLRWDLSIKPGATGEKAAVISYEFKLQYDRNVSIGNFSATK